MNKTEGSQKLHSFSPAWSDPELLEKTLVGRKELVDRYEQLIIEGVGGPNKFQSLTIGPRGSGKTHIVRVLCNRLRRNKEIMNRLLIIDLLEDELGIATFLDLVIQMIRSVIRSYADLSKQVEEELSKLLDLPPNYMKDEAVQLLLKTAGEKDILILIENLGIIFDDKKGFGSKGQQELRDFVQQYPRTMIFATAQSLIYGISESNAPFFQFFTLEHLKPMTFEESLEFLVSIAKAYGDKENAEHFQTPECRGRIKAVHEFTCGNHRLLATLYDFLTEESLKELGDKFVAWLDKLKPYYQEQMRSLPAQQQKIIIYLSQERIPRTVKEIAKGCLAAQNTISKQLNELEKKHHVVKTVVGRESHYELKEALFRICYEAEQIVEGAPIPLFLNFLGNYYSGTELAHRYHGYRLLASNNDSDGCDSFNTEAQFYLEAFRLKHPEMIEGISEWMKPTTEEDFKPSVFFGRLEEEKDYQGILHFAQHFKCDIDTDLLSSVAKAHFETGNVEDAIKEAEEILKKDERNLKALFILARSYIATNNLELSLKYAFDAFDIDPEYVDITKFLGVVLTTCKTIHNKKLEELPIILPLEQTKGWTLGGQVAFWFDGPTRAEKYFRKALELNSNDSIALVYLALICGIQEKLDESYENLNNVLNIAPDLIRDSYIKGSIHYFYNRYELAEKYLKIAARENTRDHHILELLREVFSKNNNFHNAVDFFTSLTEIDPESSEVWNQVGQVSLITNDMENAERSFNKSLEIDKENLNAKEGLFIAFLLTRRPKEAYNLYDNIEFEDIYVSVLFFHGNLLKYQGKFTEAIELLKEAHNLEPKSIITIFNLVTAYLGKGTVGTALRYIKKVLDTDSQISNKIGCSLIQDNLETLFIHSSEISFRKFLEKYIEFVNEKGYLEFLEKALPMTVFGILKKHETISEERFTAITTAIEKWIKPKTDVSVVLRFLDVGFEYFKKNDKKALLKLPLEERRVFCKELGIDLENLF